MLILVNTLELVIDTWDDPGDYPNGLASGPLPSYSYVAGVDGVLGVELQPSDIKELQTEDLASILDFILENMDLADQLEHVTVTKWNIRQVPVEGHLIFELDAEDIDASSWESPSGPEEEYNLEDEYDFEKEEW